MKVSTKLYVGFILQFIVASALIITTTLLQESQEKDSIVINLAGRQRMLSQKLTKEILLFAQGDLPAESVNKTMTIFNDTMKGLANGGRAPLDLDGVNSVQLPKPTDRGVIEQLQKVESIWNPFLENAGKFLKEQAPAGLEHIKKNNVTLLKEMDRAVSLMDQESAKKVQFVSNLLKAGQLALVVIFLITLYVIRKNVQNLFNLLEQLTGGLRANSTKIWEVGSLISASSFQLAEGASEQAAAIEETSASLEETASMTKQNADNANQANLLMHDTGQVVEQANRSMNELTGAMKDITVASEETAKIVKTY
jgi:methyl-accepting chemotaxis protein